MRGPVLSSSTIRPHNACPPWYCVLSCTHGKHLGWGSGLQHFRARTPRKGRSMTEFQAEDAGRRLVASLDRKAPKGRPRTALVALGGNALLERGEEPTSANQTRHARIAAESLARLTREEGVVLLVTHGNGPQVGLLALQAPEMELDMLGAESEGQIGYLLESEISGQLEGAQVVALLTQTVVDPKDPAFQNPSKFIGPMYSQEDAERLSKEKGWVVKADGDKGFRRVVASPKPVRIIEVDAIQVLLREGIITICTGGGGIPVAEETDVDGKCTKRRYGVEAVVDKDAASALLGAQVKADIMLLLTDAPAVFDPSKWPKEKAPVPSPITPDELEALGNFAAGSMGPKVAAALDFVRKTGGVAGIGALGDAVEIVRGQKGTLIVPHH